MKLLFISKNLSIGGGEKKIITLSREAGRHNQVWDIAVVENRIDFPIDGLIIKRLTPNQLIPRYLYPFYLPVIIVRLLKIGRKYDVFMTYERTISYLAFLVSFILRKKYIINVICPIKISFRYIYKNRFRYYLNIFLHDLIFHFCWKIVTVNPEIKKEISDDFHIKKVKINVISSPIDTPGIDRAIKQKLSKTERQLFGNNRIMLSVGRLHFQKNYSLMLNIFRQVSLKIGNIKLIIIGDGQEKEKIMEMIKSFNLEGKVIMMGTKINPYKYFNNADFYITTSLFESFGQSILEALYLGKRIIISSDLLGINSTLRKAITERSASGQFYIIDKSPNLNANKISEYILNEKSEISKSAVKEIQTLYSPEKIYSNYSEIIN